MVQKDSPPTSWKEPATRAEREANLKFAETELPVELPCDAPSYVVQKVESPDVSTFSALFVKSPVILDFGKVFFAIFSGLLAMYAAVFRADVKDAALLTFFAMAYPILMMFLLLTRSNDLTLKKECYYLLLKYKCLMDWNNWVWWRSEGQEAYVIWWPPHCSFFLFWLVTTCIQIVYASLNNSAYTEEGCPRKAGWIVVLIVLLQVSVLFVQFLAMLKVEEGGIITLNKFLENKQGQLVAKDAEKYIDSRAHPEGLLHDRPIVIVPENYIRTWAVTRFWQLPWSAHLLVNGKPKTVSDGAEAEEYKCKLEAWEKIAKGDLLALRCLQEPGWAGVEVPALFAWLFNRLWGYSLVCVLCVHPDFAHMRPALRSLMKVNTWKFIASMVIAMGFEMYAIYLIVMNNFSS